MHLRAATSGRFEPQTDLNSLDRLHRHDRLGDPTVELDIPLGVRPQTERQTLDANLQHAAERVAFFADLVDQRLHLGIGRRVERVQLASVAQGELLREGTGLRFQANPAEF